MKVLIACEYSGVVREAFVKLGHDAMSCDLLPTEQPGNHYQGDVRDVLYENWDMVIAHPPCTFLSVAGNRWFNEERYGDKALSRKVERVAAANFFKIFTDIKCEKVAIENPIGFMSNAYQKPDQIIHPYFFGDPERKATCLWLKGLEKLVSTNIVQPEIITYKNGKGTDSPWHLNSLSLPAEERRKVRSKTFQGVADAMASQWGGNIHQKEQQDLFEVAV
ncbi:DNA cytosine methyltransferase [Acinetobacter bereziniae]|uniref:DNA cytosine methyltransferase n=1 Tax=Acinetobacter bereziniae TaxID=106648 RepID=UPI00158006F6|nr:DNA cytosine methyltransferase [Acinetobacter bereziniae]NUG06163.1 DNA cytosine methyltransferase [Acinetobacter bereziniae]NUG62318.1 DNA cytosine methyltransferase [Acinetobacter bereziniae]NUG69180.1 DNA cytosine methyltransferase [Acinetobacter bereziniae]NUG78526.1 DNA cytosine methyltransferase [Acinetobacter bereziniae]